MAVLERVTITLPQDLLREVDRVETNRSRFVTAAVRRELQERRREELRRSLSAPHPDSESFTESDLDDWARRLPEEDAESLVAIASGTQVQWVQGQGWVEDDA
jgi:hypothetical protein